MRIAMLGTRGIPASYSGFETCVEELGSRLVQRGHEVTVYCRSHHIRYEGEYYEGMRLVKLPTIQNKYLDTIVHTFLSTLHVLPRPIDVVLVFIAGNSLVSFIPRLAGKKVVLNVDGLDWKRQKWPFLAKKYIQFAEQMACILPNAMVTDSRVIQNYYLQRYGQESTHIAYGAEVGSVPPGNYLQRFGLEPRRYILFVGRLVPENCAHHLVEAFEGLKTDMKCVIVGHAPYAEGYIRALKGTKNPSIIFTGYLFGEGYRELSSNAYLFVETSEVGGTHPALLEAMGYGNCVVVNDTEENLETIGEAGFSYRGSEGAASLAKVLQELIQEPALVEAFRKKAQERVNTYYSWEVVTEAYERLFLRLLHPKSATEP
jgi:glycosyltransferase involved in cell wall biosynthesis